MQGSTGAAGVSSPQGVYLVGKHLIMHGATVKFANLGYAAMQNADLTSADFSYASCECVDVGLTWTRWRPRVAPRARTSWNDLTRTLST